MEEKAPKTISSTIRSTARAVKVVHISNPTMVKTSASEFRAVVQSLTGQKRSSCTSSGHREEMNFYSDDQYSPQVKVPKLNEDVLQCSDHMKSSVSALIDDNATVTNSCSVKDHGELEIQPIQNPDSIPSQCQVFEALESIGDARHFTFDISSPSIIFSEFEYL